jgi:hypothetical protein
MDAADQLTRFPGRILSHRTGIDHDKMRGFGLFGDLMAGFLESLSPGFQFGFVKAAA